MKILFIGGLGCGGAEHQMVILAKQLAERGYDVFFVTADKNGFFGDELEKSKVRVIENPQKRVVAELKLNIPYSTRFLFRLVKEESVDVGISFLGANNFINCILSLLMRGKYKAITGLRNARESLLLSRRELLYTKFERFASLKVCNSDNARIMYAKHFPQYQEKLRTIYNVVNLPPISSQYKIRQDGKTHFIVPASYRVEKNPYGLLNALKLMTPEELELFDVTWYGATCNGESPYYVQLRGDIQKANLQDVLILKDATKDIANKMYETDVVALFSSSEGLPNAICEGMMIGKPIVMTRVSDYGALVDESNGMLCNWNDSHSIKNALIYISKLSDRELLEMGVASHSKAERLFSEDSNISKWIEIVNKVTNN